MAGERQARERSDALSRRAFLARTSRGVGALALGTLLARDGRGASRLLQDEGGSLPHFPPRAKRVIYLFMSGGPSHLELFDGKPLLTERQGQELPDSVRGDQRLTAQTDTQGTYPVVGSPFGFSRCGESGIELGRIIPHIGSIADRMTLIRSMYTEPINHDPAVTYLLTGNQQPGRPVMGSWVSYGLGSENESLPHYVVMLSGRGGQPLHTRYWHSGFLPGHHQGVQLRGGEDPVLYLSNPPGIDRGSRRRVLDRLRELDEIHRDEVGDPEIDARIRSYEMAFRMQASVPELADLSREPAETLDLYGATPGTPSFANNCLLARRLAERGVRFIQLYHRDWDHHQQLPQGLRKQCGLVDRASAALVKDLERRGLLDDTLVIWSGEFGRTPYSQGTITRDGFGRDHHCRAFSLWMAGGGMKRGHVHGRTDDFGWDVVENAVHVNDFQATVLRALGIDHERLTYRHQGRDFRLTDVAGRVVEDVLA